MVDAGFELLHGGTLPRIVARAKSVASRDAIFPRALDGSRPFGPYAAADVGCPAPTQASSPPRTLFTCW
jgi:hypothetical protein